MQKKEAILVSGNASAMQIRLLNFFSFDQKRGISFHKKRMNTSLSSSSFGRNLNTFRWAKRERLPSREYLFWMDFKMYIWFKHSLEKQRQKVCDCWAKSHSQMRFDVALYFVFAKSLFLGFIFIFLVCYWNLTQLQTQFNINGSSVCFCFIYSPSSVLSFALSYCYCFCSNAANVLFVYLFIFFLSSQKNQIHVDETSLGFINLHNALLFI